MANISYRGMYGKNVPAWTASIAYNTNDVVRATVYNTDLILMLPMAL